VQDPLGICQRLRQLVASGGTDISLALQSLHEQISQLHSKEREVAQRLVLLTDGYTKEKTEEACRQAAASIGQAGVPLIVLGLGVDWNSELMEQLYLQNSSYVQGGQAAFLPDPQQIAGWFDQIFKAAQAAVISNVRLVLRLSLGVTPIAVYRVIPLISDLGFQPISERSVMVTLGDLEKDNGQFILFRTTIPPRQVADKFRLGLVEVTYDVPTYNMVNKQIRQDIIVEYTTDPSRAEQVDLGVMNLLEKVRAFKLQTVALRDISEGKPSNATIKLTQAVTILLNQGDYDQAATLKAEIENLEQQGKLSEKGEKTIRFDKNKTIRFNQ
jgi:Ca-activated chloride channel family protein